MNYLRKIGSYLYIAVSGIFAILSVVSIVMVLSKAFLLRIEISYEGLTRLLTLFEVHGALYSATFVLIGTYYVVRQVRLGVEANNITKYSTWLFGILPFLENIAKRNEEVKDQILFNAHKIFDYLTAHNFVISTKNELADFYQKFISPNLQAFEEASAVSKGQGLIYPQDNASPLSWAPVWEIMQVIAPSSSNYKSYRDDLNKLMTDQIYSSNWALWIAKHES